MKYKKILLIVIVYLLLCTLDVFAKDVQVFFITEGGSTNTNGFKIIDDYVNRTDGTYCATYKSNGTIKTLNSINGASFSIYKNGTNLVSGREWYTYNYSNNKLYYFNQNNSYNIDEVLQKLSMRGDPYPVISLFAHWKGDGLDDGIDIGGTSKNTGKTKDKELNKTIKIKSISISGSSRITKGKSTTLKVTIKPSNAKKETITWSSSNKKIASVNNSGKVTGISKGTVTITAKTSSGKKSTFKVTIVEEVIHKVKISFNMNGGRLESNHAKTLSSLESNVIRVKDNSKIVQTIAYGSKTTSAGLPNYNNPDYLNVGRVGYIAKKGAEWNTKPDGSGKSYNHNKVYKASDFCNAKSSDCNVTLYVNWEKKKNNVYIKYNMNGGRLAKNHSKSISAGENKVLCSGKEECQKIEYGKSIPSGSLLDYNYSWGLNILREGYYVISGIEWNTKPDGSGKSYNQKKIYKSSDFCNAKDKDCSVTLYVNWKAKPLKTNFEISYYHGIRAQQLNDYQLNLIKNAGFTLIPINASNGSNLTLKEYHQEMDKAIRRLNSVGIKALVREKGVYVNDNNYKQNDDYWNKKIIPMVDFYSRYRNVIAYDIKDEPHAKDFNRLGKINKTIMNYDSNRYAYINLLPNYAGNSQLGFSSYDKYINNFISTVNPKVLSVDHYTCFSKNGSVSDHKNSYYSNLNKLRVSSKKNNSLPMMILLLTEHGTFKYLTANDLAFEVNTALAFGMKRVSYFTYSLWYDHYKAKNAMMDSNNNPTPHYYDIKATNQWLYPLGKQLYSKNVSKIYGFNEVSELTKYNNSISFLGKITGKNAGILSLFNDNSFMLVNTELSNKTTVFRFPSINLNTLKWFNTNSSSWESITKSFSFNHFYVNTSNNTITIDQGYSILLKK